MGGCAWRTGNKARTPSAVLTSNPPPGPKLPSHTWRSCPPGSTEDRSSSLWESAASAALDRAEAEGGELAASSPASSGSPRCARGLEAAPPGFPAPLPPRVSSLPPAPLHPRPPPPGWDPLRPPAAARRPQPLSPVFPSLLIRPRVLVGPPRWSREQFLKSGNRNLGTQRKRLLPAPAEGQA